MKLLLINSVSANPFCALYTGDYLSASFSSDFFDKDLYRTSRVPDKLIYCLNSIAKKYPAVFHEAEAVSVVTGPGSFTGIRVGIAIAKGVSLALNKKILPVTNFELTLNRLPKIETGKRYCVLIPAKLPEYYYAFMLNGKELNNGYIQISDISAILNPLPASPSERGLEGKVTLVCDFDDETKIKLDYFNLLNVKEMKPETDSMLELSIKYYNEGRFHSPDTIEPFYIKDFIVKK